MPISVVAHKPKIKSPAQNKNTTQQNELCLSVVIKLCGMPKAHPKYREPQLSYLVVAHQ